MRWGLTRDPVGKRPVKAWFSTKPAHLAEEILCAFGKRWSLEAPFEARRAHLDIEPQRP
jgi:hypothetical protein